MPLEFIQIIKPANRVNLSSIVGGPVPQSKTYESDSAQEASGVIGPIYDERFPEQYPHVVKIGTQYFVDGRNILMSGDAGGGGGGGDADTLEGQSGSYYLNYANFTGNPGALSGISFVAPSGRYDNLYSNGDLYGVRISGSVSVRSPSGEFTNFFAGTMSTPGNITVGGFTNVTGNSLIGSSSSFTHSSRSRIFSAADGRHNLTNSASTGYTRLTFGPEIATSPALKGAASPVIGSGLHAVNGNDSAYISFTALSLSGTNIVLSPLISGTVASAYQIFAENNLTAETFTCNNDATIGGSVLAGTLGRLSFSTRSRMQSSTNGLMNVSNSANNGFTRFTLGPETSSFPSLKSNGSTLQIRTGDDGAYAPLEASTFATVTTITAGTSVSGQVSVRSPSGEFTNLRAGSASFVNPISGPSGAFTNLRATNNIDIGNNANITSFMNANVVNATTYVQAGTDVLCGAGNSIGQLGRAKIWSAGDGRFNFLNNGQSAFTRLTLGLESAGHPALRNRYLPPGIQFRNGDDSAYIDIEASIVSGTYMVTAPSGNFATVCHSGNYTLQINDGTPTTAQTVNWGNGNTHTVTLGGAVTFTFTAPLGPAKLQLMVRQDSGGSKTAVWPASVRWPAGAAPTLTSTANAIDIINFWYDGTNYYGTSALAFA